MYIRIEFMIILAVFFVMFFLVLGVGWYHLYLKMKGEGIVIGEKKRQLERERVQAELERLEEELEEEKRLNKSEEAGSIESREGLEEKHSQIRTAGNPFVISLFKEIRVPLKDILETQEQILYASSMSEAKKYARKSQKSGEVIFSIINDILDISKIEEGQYRFFKENYVLDEILQKILTDAREKANEKGISFVTEVNSNIPQKLVGDVTLVKKVLESVLRSAIQNTQEGSVSLKLDFYSDKDGICLTGTVDDTGIGIRQDDMSFLFELYERGDVYNRLPLDAVNLGLNVCRRVLELAGGSLQIESVYGTGSRISFEIPQQTAVTVAEKATEPEKAKPEKVNHRTQRQELEVKAETVKEKKAVEQFIIPPAKEPEKAVASEAKILIVDDNVVNVRLLIGLLESYEFQIEAVYSGQQCLDEIAKNQDYTLILLDHMMPEMDGIETLHRIRDMEGAYFAKVPVIALTATVAENIKEKFLAEGFQDFVAKPVNIDEILEVLQKYIQSEKKTEISDKPETEPETFSIEGVDMSIGLHQWNGNLDKYKMILEVVYADGKIKLEEMKEHLSNKDYNKYMIEVHSAKSVTASIGAMAVSELAKEQEFAVKNNTLEIVETKSEVFLEAYSRLLINIGNSLHVTEKPEETVTELLPITVEEVEGRMEKIGMLIEQYEDEEAVWQLEELLKYNIEIYPVSFVKEIIENLNRLDYAKAGDRIKNRRSEFDEENIISRR